MPKKIRTHTLEEISRREFIKILPEEWIWRDQVSDYGIDGEIEIVENGVVTGNKVYIQLKAVDETTKNNHKKVQVAVSTLNYYAAQKYPVIIMRYILKENMFYGKYYNEIDYDNKTQQTSVTVSFNEEDIVNEEYFENLEKYFIKIKKLEKLKFPIKISIKVKSDVTPQIKNFLEAEEAFLENDLGSKFIEIVSEKEALVKFEIDKKDILILVPEKKGISLDNIMKGKGKDGLGEIFDIAITNLILYLNEIEMLAEYIYEKKLENLLINSRMEEIFLVLLKSSYSDRTDSVINFLIKKREEFSDFYILVLLNLENSRIRKILENNVIDSKDYYNLANGMRVRDLKAALRLYVLTYKKDDFYKDKSYFFSDLGGVFFLLKKYEWAVKNYKKSLELEKDDFIEYLYADSLLYSGKYEEALQYFSKKSEMDEKIGTMKFLKSLFLKHLIEERGVKEQTRVTVSNKIKVYIEFKEKGISKDKKQIEGFLKMDYLDADNWFNMAISEENNEKKAWYFLYAAIVGIEDYESWINAWNYFRIIEEKETELVRMSDIILITALDSIGESIIPYFLKGVSPEEKRNVKKQLKKIAKDLSEKKNQKIYRIYDYNDLNKESFNFKL